MKKNFVESNFNKLGAKKLLLINRILLTMVGIWFFIIWLVFITNNFYPRASNNIADKLMSLPVEASIWPVTFIALFIFIMPIWTTSSFKLLITMLTLCLIISVLTFVFLAFLLITVPWIVWLLLNIFTYAILLFSMISIIHLNRHEKEKS